MSPKIQLRVTIDETLNDRLTTALTAGAARTASQAVELALTSFLDEHDARRDPLAISFDAYVQSILAPRYSNNGRINVMGDGSYQSELQYAADAFKDHGSFGSMPLSVREHVGGIGNSTGYLGNMRGAAWFKPHLRNTPEVIARHLDKLPFAGPIDSDLVREVVAGLCGESGMRIPSASRMLAVKRPDLFVPVNGANREQVESHFGRVRYESASGVDDYLRMLDRIYACPWFNAERPERSDAERRFVWENRVALLDALFYAPRIEVEAGQDEE